MLKKLDEMIYVDVEAELSIKNVMSLSSDVLLKDGNIINIDVSTIYNGFFSDSSRMFCIGNVSPKVL